MNSQFDSPDQPAEAINPPENQAGQTDQGQDSRQRTARANGRTSRSLADEPSNQPVIDSFTSEHKKGLIVIASIVICLFCLLGMLSPDGRTFEKEFRNDVKNGTQVKDVVAYFKDRDLNWSWDKNKRELTVLLPGKNWVPFIHVDYKESAFFDNFNRLKGRTGSMEYKFFRQ